MKKSKKNISFNESEEMITTLHDYYKNTIREVGEKIGMKELSRTLGFNENYIFKIVKKDSIDALRKIVKRIHVEILDTKG